MAMKHDKKAKEFQVQTRASSCGQSEDEGWMDRDGHSSLDSLRIRALLNDVILKILFGYVRRQDLKAFRVVCKKWNLHAITRMRTSFPITLNRTDSSTDTRRIDYFVQLFKSNVLGIPFTRFKVGPFHATDGAGHLFLQLCGDTATEIDLYRGHSSGYQIEDVTEILRSSPNLKVLGFPCNLSSRSQVADAVKLFPDLKPELLHLKNIIFRPEYKYSISKCCPTAIEELLRAAPNVCGIVVEERYGNEENGSGNAVFDAIEKLGKESSIQSLDLRRVKLDVIQHLLRMKGLKLKTLNITLASDEDFHDTLAQLATTFKDTLQHLKFQCADENIWMEFPRMSLLKSLTLDVSQVLVPNYANLNRYFPVLETLDFDILGDGLAQLFARSDTCSSVKSFRVRMDMTIKTFHNIRRVFPKLTELNLTVGDDGGEILRQIWSHMTGLESLAIFCWKWKEGNDELELDSTCTGIPAGLLREIRPVVDELDNMSVRERKETILKLKDEHSSHPSISNLEKLRRLTLDISGENWSICLSDLTGYLALYSMNHLRHLNIQRCEMSRKCCVLLTKDNELDSWNFRKRSHEYIIPPFDLQ